MKASTQTSWRTRQLGDLLKYEQPGRYLVRSTDYSEQGKYPVLTAGKTFVLGYTNEPNGAYTDHPVIIFDDFTTASKYVDFDFKAKSSAMKMLTARAGAADLRFVYERMQLIRYPIFDHKRRWIAEYSKLEIEAPELVEQTAIAEVANDLADHIAALERLIAKKQAIKQGMMQQLLTGRTRLPGFTEPWGEQASFEDLCTRSTGFWGASDLSASSPNRVHVITAGDITPEGHLKGAATRYFSNAQVAKARCMTDDLVVTSSGNGLGKTAYIDEPGTLAASNFVRILRPRKGVSGSFLAQVMRTPAARGVLDSNTATSAYPNLLPGFFTERWIPRPPSDEQLAIAGVLQDADVEIAALRARVNKARDVKTGMMQQLLSGRARLQVEAVS